MRFVNTQSASLRRARRVNRIEEIRSARGLLRSQLASALVTTESKVRRWELGITPVPDEQKFEIAEFLGVDVPYLMGWTDERAAA